MKKQSLFTLTLFGLFLVATSAGRAQAQTPTDQLDYPACNCIPRYAGAFDGSGSDGFTLPQDFGWNRWNIGIFYNYDDDEFEELHCPVNYDHRFRRADGRIAPLLIEVDVIDEHSGEEVVVEVFGRTATGNAVSLGSAFTSNTFTGKTTLSVTAAPTTLMRYLWIKVTVPDYAAAASGVIGYRVSRVL